MADIDEIRMLDSGVAEAINAGNASAVTAHYTQDATLLPPGAERMEGREAIQGYWQAGIAAGLTDVSIVASSIEISGDSSVTVGKLSGKMGDTEVTGKYIVIGKKTDQGWKINVDIWNFDA